MWLGRDKHRVDEYHNQTWVKQIKIIGIHFKNDISAERIEDNWTKKDGKHEQNYKTMVMKKPEYIWKGPDSQDFFRITFLITCNPSDYQKIY